VIRDRVRDEAIAIAKAWSHPTVELRHVLWGLVRVLGAAAPAEVQLATVKAFLEPAGSSYETPLVSPAAEAAILAIDDEASAVAAVLDLAKRLGPGGADAVPPPIDPTPTAGPTPTDAGEGGAAEVTTATEVTGTDPSAARNENRVHLGIAG
jgi:hypothetical protein